MEEEGGVVLAVVGNHSDQLVEAVAHGGRVWGVEDLGEAKRCPKRVEQRHHVLQGRTLAVPHDPHGDDLRLVRESPADLDFGTAGTL